MSKVILITGTSSGIGKACADYLAKRGHKVYGTSRSPENVLSNHPVIKLDVTDHASVTQAVKHVLQNEGRIDVLVNNAGFSMGGAIEHFTEEEMHHDMQTFFFGTVRMTKAVLPGMRERNSGTIINISSIAGLMGLPFQGFYSASKFALQGFCESLRMELRPHNIHVVTVNPGDIITGVSAHRIVAKAAHEPNHYITQWQRTHSRINQDESNGSDPHYVVRVVEKIIHARTPATQYIIGRFDQKLAVWVKNILPSRWFARIIGSHYGID